MRAAKKLAMMGCATMALYLLTVSGAAEQLGELAAQRGSGPGDSACGSHGRAAAAHRGGNRAAVEAGHGGS